MELRPRLYLRLITRLKFVLYSAPKAKDVLPILKNSVASFPSPNFASDSRLN